MNLAIKHGLLILSVTSAMVTTFSSTAIAGTEGKQQYYCKGNHGDDNDRGLWDYIFTASSKEDAESQAEKQYKVDGPNAFVNIKDMYTPKLNLSNKALISSMPTVARRYLYLKTN